MTETITMTVWNGDSDDNESVCVFEASYVPRIGEYFVIDWNGRWKMSGRVDEVSWEVVLRPNQSNELTEHTEVAIVIKNTILEK